MGAGPEAEYVAGSFHTVGMQEGSAFIYMSRRTGVHTVQWGCLLDLLDSQGRYRHGSHVVQCFHSYTDSALTEQQLPGLSIFSHINCF